MTVVRMIARPLLASMFVVGGVNAVRNAESLAPKAKGFTDRVLPQVKRVAPGVPVPDDPMTFVRANGALQVVLAGMLATGTFPRVAAAGLAGTLIPVTVAGHPFWEESDSTEKANQRVHFFKNVSMLGGVLLAAVDTEGKPGIAWRTRNVAKTAKREAKQARRTVKREAKLARKSLGG